MLSSHHLCIITHTFPHLVCMLFHHHLCTMIHIFPSITFTSFEPLTILLPMASSYQLTYTSILLLLFLLVDHFDKNSSLYTTYLFFTNFLSLPTSRHNCDFVESTLFLPPWPRYFAIHHVHSMRSLGYLRIPLYGCLISLHASHIQNAF